jgi:hypothetical protein
MRVRRCNEDHAPLSTTLSGREFVEAGGSDLPLMDGVTRRD